MFDNTHFAHATANGYLAGFDLRSKELSMGRIQIEELLIGCTNMYTKITDRGNTLKITYFVNILLACVNSIDISFCQYFE